MPNPTPSNGFTGFQNPWDTTDHLSSLRFVVAQQMAKAFGAHVVQVTEVSNAGGVAAVGTVKVTILVNQIDGLGHPTPHGIINSLPYLRMQGGTNALIIDPVVGDIGVAVFCDRDISAVKASRGRANPGSRRRFSASDGIYLGSVITSVPTQYVRFSASGIEIVSPTAVVIRAPAVQVNP